MMPRPKDALSPDLQQLDAVTAGWWREFDGYAAGSHIRRDRSDLLLADTARRCGLTPAAAVAALRNRKPENVAA